MEKSMLMSRLYFAPQIKDKIAAVHCLEPFLTDPIIVQCLCVTAIMAIDHRLREALIQTLKKNEKMANRYFINSVLTSLNPDHRCRALINLSLMECRLAKKAVMKGLMDRVKSVRIAAALNTGLYDDEDFLEVLDDFFAREEHNFFDKQTCQTPDNNLNNPFCTLR